MKVLIVFSALQALAHCIPVAEDCHGSGVAYHGIYANEVEGFVGIRFAHDTSAQNRFKPPRPYVPVASSTIYANETGPACPQQVTEPGSGGLSLSISVISDISEDCLRLNVWRPNGTKAGDKLPVLAYIYGGGFTGGSKDDIIQQPGGLILQSIENGYPVMAVEMNYRLGVFGFAQSDVLLKEGSTNAGVRDQRLALDWVHDNIESFGGDSSRVTIHGQSSGGLAVGMQIMAFGADRPYPFQQAVCQSQALEPGITGNFTREAMAAIWEATGCNSSSLDSEATVDCLRGLPMHKLLNAQLDTANSDTSANLGDQWLPVVDGEGGFLPAAPSTLIEEGRFGNISTMIGWCDNDAVLFTPSSVISPNDTYTQIRDYLPGMTDAHVHELLSLYPPGDFETSHFPNGSVELHAEVYRCGRIIRDILFTCQPIHYGEAISSRGNNVYLYDQNQTMLTPALHSVGLYGLGVVHTSDLVFVFGNLSKFDVPGIPYHPSSSDFELRTQESRSWSTFAAVGQPSLEGHDTLPGWQQAEFNDENFGVYVIGGPNKGFSGSMQTSTRARTVMAAEKLRERCGFLNRPDIIKELQY